MEYLNHLFMPLQTLLFIAIWSLTHMKVLKSGPIPGARTFTRYNSRFYAAASFFIFYLTLQPSHEILAQRLYYYSKFYEYVDILGVCAAGSTIGLHFGFHHLTTPYLTFVRTLRYTDGWNVFATCNTFHHALMYAHFGGIARLREILEYTGALQLLAGMATEVWFIWQKTGRDDVLWPHIFALSILFTYLILWARDLHFRG